ncbi:hypothetical protein D3C72_2267780 [compost metagenome]
MNAASGEIRSFCRKISAPTTPVQPAASTYTISLVRNVSTPRLPDAGSESRIDASANPCRERSRKNTTAMAAIAIASAVK